MISQTVRKKNEDRLVLTSLGGSFAGDLRGSVGQSGLWHALTDLTLDSGSSAKQASRMASETWSL
jgi:hypothetical protein